MNKEKPILEPEGYDCELIWYWSGKYHNFQETYQFSIKKLEDIPEVIKRFIVNVTRKYAGSKYNGKIDRYNISLGVLQVTPHINRFYLYPNKDTQLFLNNEWENVGQMMEEDCLFVDSKYNYQTSEKNNNLDIKYVEIPE